MSDMNDDVDVNEVYEMKTGIPNGGACAYPESSYTTSTVRGLNSHELRLPRSDEGEIQNGIRKHKAGFSFYLSVWVLPNKETVNEVGLVLYIKQTSSISHEAEPSVIPITEGGYHAIPHFRTGCN